MTALRLSGKFVLSRPHGTKCRSVHPSPAKGDTQVPFVRKLSKRDVVNRNPQQERAARATPHALVASLGTLAQPVRWAVLGAAAVGMVGAIVGLIVGLYVYAPTAPVATVELGFPATIVGGCVGLIVGTILAAGRRISRNHP